jgi:hypothetical protein
MWPVRHQQFPHREMTIEIVGGAVSRAFIACAKQDERRSAGCRMKLPMKLPMKLIEQAKE